MNSKHEKCEKNSTPSHVIIKLLQISDKEKALEVSRVERHIYVEGHRGGWQQISCWKQCKQEDSGTTALNYWKKKPST